MTGLGCRQVTSIYFCKFYFSFFAQPLKRFTRIEDDALHWFVFATQECFLFQREDEARAGAFCARTEDIQHPAVVAVAVRHLRGTCREEAKDVWIRLRIQGEIVEALRAGDVDTFRT